MNRNLFQNLFVFDMANNHMGDVEHGLRIINELHIAAAEFAFPCAIKFQYRDLDTFIHPSYKDSFEFKYVKRFQETRLSDDELFRLKQEADKLDFISMCTSFDENSVDKIVDFGFDIIKVASCSFTDWPLLEKIMETDKPIIASTAGATLDEIDRVVVFLEHRRKQFAIMHCVGEYPTLTAHLELNQIEFLRNRYPEITVGYSTHEYPSNFDAIKVAIAKGGKIFERHVGIATEKYSLNAYSSTPAQVRQWLASAQDALAMCGISGARREIYEKERADLQGLMRGVFAKVKIKAGEKITGERVFYAIPNFPNQLVANFMSKYTEIIAQKNIPALQPILSDAVQMTNSRDKIIDIIKDIKNLVLKSGIKLQNKINFELSHHYGLDQFYQYGCTIMNIINREYCKKLILLLAGQENPTHTHKVKEETFHILYGDGWINLNGETKNFSAGDILTVERNYPHSFGTKTGAILEEVSTTHIKEDSYYDDPLVGKTENRKTHMTFWIDWLEKPIK